MKIFYMFSFVCYKYFVYKVKRCVNTSVVLSNLDVVLILQIGLERETSTELEADLEPGDAGP